MANTISQLDLIREAFKLQGLKVVDTSFIRTQNINYLLIPYADLRRLGAIKSEKEFYEQFPQPPYDKIAFPQEVRDESYHMISLLKRGVKSTRKKLQRRFARRPGKDEHFSINPSLRAHKRAVSEETMKLIPILRRHYDTAIYPNPLSPHIPQHIMPYLEQMKRAFAYIKDLNPQRKQDLIRNSVKREGNTANDSSIFAQAFAASFNEHVYILTSDHDYLWISRVFYNDPNRFSDKFRFPLPEGVVDIVYANKNNLETRLLTAGSFDADEFPLGQQASSAPIP